MSKELVISANRHETRVAVIEDDQVVEVYHQRENEYSLAGSIHKGRVTRVLPGMQSAFVDIGLGRDAFLYVSDFFEDNEEYDEIVSSVEDKVLKLDRTPAQQAPAVAAPVNAPPAGTPEEPIAEFEAAPVSEVPAMEAAAPLVAPASAMQGPAGGQDQRRGGDRGGDRNGRGRRSRRGRGQKGGGRALPDSKFYSPGVAEPRPEPQFPGAQSVARMEAVAPVEAPARETELRQTRPDDFFVLPGESLAKYTLPGDEDPEAAPVALPQPESDTDAAAVAEMETEAAPTAGLVAEEPLAKTAVAAPVEETPAEPAAAAPVRPALAHVEVVEALVFEKEVAEISGVTAGVDQTADQTAGETADETAYETRNEAMDEGLAEDAAEGKDPLVEQEGPEPARIPTSLTAALREQGPRYLHRVSRRMRRKGRDNRGPLPEGQRGAQGEPRPQEQRTEQRTAPAGRGGPAFGAGPAPKAGPPLRTAAEGPRAEGRPDKAPGPSISDLLKEGQEIIVQIAKEPLGQKGARITSHIALPGRFLVYMPTVDHVGVSRKIPSDDERLRLKRILQANRTGISGGYIVRTAGDGRSEEELRADMMFLYNMWLDMRQKAERRAAPMLIHHDLNVVERILRDQLTTSYKNIWVDNEEVYENVLAFVQRFQPALVSRVKLYTRQNPVFDEFGITAELEKALRPKVWLKSGGYIVINQTEALVAIDINTGKYVGKSNRLEDTIVKTNTDAIKEIVRQIRLRDLGGIIVVDFIDMDERKNRQKVMQTLEETMRADRAPYKILQFNDFGLVAITRKRVKQSLERTLCTPCAYCEGAGYVKSPQTVVGEILQEAHKISRAVEGKDVLLRVSPEVAKLLKSNQNTYLPEIEEILGGRTVFVKSDPLLHQEKFDLA
jgi:ribonuclease G